MQQPTMYERPEGRLRREAQKGGAEIGAEMYVETHCPAL